MNITLTPHKSQLNSQNIYKNIENLAPLQSKIYQVIASSSIRFFVNESSQSYIASRVYPDYWASPESYQENCRRYVNRVIRMFVDKKLLLSFYRHRMTCIYKIPPRVLQFAHQLKELIPAFKEMLFTWSLLSFRNHAKKDDWKREKEELCAPIIRSNFNICFHEKETSYEERYFQAGWKSNVNFKKIIVEEDIAIDESDYESDSPHVMFASEQLDCDLQNRNQTLPPKKKEPSMNELIVSPIIGKITEALSLSRFGQIQLIPFDEIVLEEAYQSLKRRSTPPTAPLPWIVKAAQAISEQRNIPVRNDLLKTIQHKYNIPKSAPFYLTDLKPFSSTGTPLQSATQQKKPFKPVTLADIRHLPQFKETFKMMDEEKLRAATHQEPTSQKTPIMVHHEQPDDLLPLNDVPFICEGSSWEEV